MAKEGIVTFSTLFKPQDHTYPQELANPLENPDDFVALLSRKIQQEASIMAAHAIRDAYDYVIENVVLRGIVIRESADKGLPLEDFLAYAKSNNSELFRRTVEHFYKVLINAEASDMRYKAENSTPTGNR